MLYFSLFSLFQVEDDSDSDEEVANEGAAAAAAASTTSMHHRLPGSSEVHTYKLAHATRSNIRTSSIFFFVCLGLCSRRARENLATVPGTAAAAAADTYVSASRDSHLLSYFHGLAEAEVVKEAWSPGERPHAVPN